MVVILDSFSDKDEGKPNMQIKKVQKSYFPFH